MSFVWCMAGCSCIGGTVLSLAGVKAERSRVRAVSAAASVVCAVFLVFSFVQAARGAA